MPPADTEPIYFQHPRQENAVLVGNYYLANSTAPAPTALLVHGMPGAEKNHDLAQHLRHRGMNALVLHFSGVWGSGGTYNLHTQVEDIRSALSYLQSDFAPRKVNSQKIAVIGHSMGSRAAIFAAAVDRRIGALVSICGFADYTSTRFGLEFFKNISPLLTGVNAVDVAQQFADLSKAPPPTAAIAKVPPRPVLVVHGTADEVVPFQHADLFSQEKHINRLNIEGANHAFADHRPELVQGVSDFLCDWAHL